MRQQRVVLAQEAADDQCAIELLDVRDRHAEPGDALARAIVAEIDLPQAEVDVVAAQAPREPRGQRHLLERRVRRHQRAERIATVLRDDIGEPVGGELERRRPVAIFHSPPCLIIGAVRRSSLPRAS